MAFETGNKNSFTVKAYIGDSKTLLAFNFANQADAKNLAGFTIWCQPPAGDPYFLLNNLQFEDPTKHAQVATEKPNSTANAPIQKYRWVHVPGSSHQGINPVMGNYTYTVTPRFFDANQSMQPLDSSLSATVTVPVGPFKKGTLGLGFTRGYMQSQAFAHHFGPHALLQPPDKPLIYDTSQTAGTNEANETFTFADEYGWMGSSARQQVFDLLNELRSDESLELKVFAYDFNEPDVLATLLDLAAAGRVRIILDNAQLHVTHKDSKTGKTVTTAEDQFTDLFKQKATKPAAIVRGSFARFSHDKIFIVLKNNVATKVLTGSTNFSVTGLYVNANHVLVFDDPDVAGEYDKVFEASWKVLSQFKTPSQKAATAFASNALATQPFPFQSSSVPRMIINFSPHNSDDVNKILGAISDRVKAEASVLRGNVIFAVMQLSGSDTPVYKTLSDVHADQSLFSYGISDAPQGTFFYAVGAKTGVLVTGKPGRTTLPAPFDQVPTPPGHEIHDKFVVCGLNGKDPVVYCGSSNLATGGEAQNGDNLLEIHDADVATAFAIEALLLVDHYAFLDRYADPKKPRPPKKPAGSKSPTKKTAGKGATKQGTSKKATKKSSKKTSKKTTKKTSRKSSKKTTKKTSKKPAKKRSTKKTKKTRTSKTARKK